MSATAQLAIPLTTTDHPHKTQNVLEAVHLMHMEQNEGVKLANEEIDNDFVWPEGLRPDVVHDKYDFQLPVIDLSPVLKLERLRKEIAARPEGQANASTLTSSDTEEEIIRTCEAAKLGVQRAIRAACEKDGFFQIVNHGFPLEVVEQHKKGVRQIFDLPLEEKSKAHDDPASNWLSNPGYTAMKRPIKYARSIKSLFWNEGFDVDTESAEKLYPGRLEQLTSILWPGKPENSKQSLLLSVEEYGKQASSLIFRLMNLIAASLGLPEESVEDLLGYSQHDNHLTARLRVNHYPVCPQPELTLGLQGHKDPNIITLVHQDDIGGLQFRFEDGTWHGVQPIPGAFVVNVGDLLQAWTNGRFLSSEHRVVANEKSERFSVVFFTFPGEIEQVVSPRPELVDADHPLLYKPLTMQEYAAALKAQGFGKTLEQFRIQTAGVAI